MDFPAADGHQCLRALLWVSIHTSNIDCSPHGDAAKQPENAYQYTNGETHLRLRQWPFDSVHLEEIRQKTTFAMAQMMSKEQVALDSSLIHFSL